MKPPVNRTVELHGQIDDEMANVVIAQMLFLQMQDSRAPITLDIDSQGGSVTASLAIVDTMDFLTPTVATRCRSMAAGTALLILASGRKGHRSALADSDFQMVRTVGGATTGSQPEARIFFERLQRRLASLFACASGRSEQEITSLMNDETVFTADGLLAFGMIDRVES